MLWNLTMKTNRDLEDDSQFLKNLQALATRSCRSKRDEVLGRLLDEMSFWNITLSDNVHDVSNTRHKDHRLTKTAPNGWRGTTGSLSFGLRRSLGIRKMKEPEKNLKPPMWKKAIDPISGKAYYYDSISKKTQWEKPLELDFLEKKIKEEQRKNDMMFFKEMETNIMSSLRRGEFFPRKASEPENEANQNLVNDNLSQIMICPFNEVRPQHIVEEAPISSTGESNHSKVRTISCMDEVLLAELRSQIDANTKQDNKTGKIRYQRPRAGKPPLSSLTYESELSIDETSPVCQRKLSPVLSLNEKHLKHGHPCEGPLVGETLLDEPIQKGDDFIEDLMDQPTFVQHVRRNTEATFHVQNTIFNPNIEATIKCVCCVYRAHVLQSKEYEKKSATIFSNTRKIENIEFEVFTDQRFKRSTERQDQLAPSFVDIFAFYEEFYRRSKMEHDTIIMSLIYVERLVKATNGVLVPNAKNWRSILFACMVLASKVWDDLSMWNVDFSNVSAATVGLSAFTLPRINRLEIALLKALNFDVRVPAGEYAKYYFLIRTMSLRSGLVQEGSDFAIQQQRDILSSSGSRTLHDDKNKLKFHISSKTNATTADALRNGKSSQCVRQRMKSFDGVLSFLSSQ